MLQDQITKLEEEIEYGKKQTKKNKNKKKTNKKNKRKQKHFSLSHFLSKRYQKNNVKIEIFNKEQVEEELEKTKKEISAVQKELKGKQARRKEEGKEKRIAEPSRETEKE